ncbi:MAG: helix-turn-helix domain-containing protein [Acidimicrobiales bacterium]
MTQDDLIESTARRRLRSLRMARGWSIDELARRSHIGPSTISRLETGHRRLALDHLVTLARALDTTIDELLADDEPGDDVVIRPTRDTANGATYWMLTRHDHPSGRIVAKLRVPAPKRPPQPRVHPGRDWFYVLHGTVRLLLGGREHLVEVGQAAEFDTMTPHRILGYGGPAEILTIFDRHGEQAHLRPS